MSDQNNDQVVENNDPQDVGNANNGASINDPQGDGDQQNIDQSNVRTDDTDWKSQARKWESRSRANKQKVEELEHELEQNKASYEATIQQMKEAQERSNAIVQVADQYGVDVAILRFDYQSECHCSKTGLKLLFAGTRSKYVFITKKLYTVWCILSSV